MAQPIIKTKGSAGADLSISKDVWLMPFQTKLVMTEYFYDVPDARYFPVNNNKPPEKVMQVHTDVRPRSSISKRGILVHLGLIDGDYVGNKVGVIMTNLTPFPKRVKAGRVAQLVITFNCTGQFFRNEGGDRTGGFGSTNVTPTNTGG